ncbi:hypothetical protein EV682_10849 [Iodobacter fluviatilis]|uniref:Uncharacterized protein n=2 Tax=Iodobacter fluviatilis TaxID=537 RepID=A0A377SVE6_9NEIS|nr:hypothetical protein EV682_10849 [Iodobacter fluviatilis]STR45290.1 Uncharacterised protein [Iodobacter fluviatilis]
MIMPSTYSVPILTNDAQRLRLQALQAEFCNACNLVAPISQQHRCWHRVTLHHLAYRVLREQHPDLGAQMACNAIYAVCRAYRTLYEHPQSKWKNLPAESPLPNLLFLASAPVYFDRHTLSIKDNILSMFTLEGRLRFQLQLPAEVIERFASHRLREIVLTQIDLQYVLNFIFLDIDEESQSSTDDEWPEYLLTLESPQTNTENV